MQLKNLVKLELPHIKKVINDLRCQGLSSGALPQIYKNLSSAVYDEVDITELACVGPIPDLPDYSPRHNSLDAGDEDGVIAQMIYQNLVEKVWQDRIATSKLIVETSFCRHVCLENER